MPNFDSLSLLRHPSSITALLPVEAASDDLGLSEVAYRGIVSSIRLFGCSAGRFSHLHCLHPAARIKKKAILSFLESSSGHFLKPRNPVAGAARFRVAMKVAC